MSPVGDKGKNCSSCFEIGSFTAARCEVVGTSTESWEKAARTAVERASKSLRDLRVAEVVEQDVVIEKGKVTSYRTKLKLSFKYEGEG